MRFQNINIRKKRNLFISNVKQAIAQILTITLIFYESIVQNKLVERKNYIILFYIIYFLLLSNLQIPY